jgi:hypothetical protein
MANYRWSICEPDNPKVIEKGSIRKEDALNFLAAFLNNDTDHPEGKMIK